MKKKALLIAAAAAAFVFAAPITAKAATPGWNAIDGYWFYADEEGNYETSEWVDGGQYYVDSDGMMVSDGSYWTVTKTKDETTGLTDYTYAFYVFDENGKVITTPGWAHAGENWYWINEKGFAGVICTHEEHTTESEAGWVLDGGKWYYVQQDGRMVTGGYSVCDNPEADYVDRTYTKYWFKPNGEMITGWYNYDPTSTYGDWVYCDANGAGHDGWLSDGKWYYLNDGALYTNGTYVTGDTPSSSDFKDENGNVDYDAYNKAFNEYCDSHRYYFDPTGAMVYGWYHYEYTDSLGRYYDTWYYTDPNTGVAGNGWLKDGATWYYISAGKMLRNQTFYDDGNEPEFNEKYPSYPDYSDYEKEDGTTDSDAYSAALDKYYEARRTYEIAYEKYVEDLKAYKDTHNYIFDENGAMVTGWYSISDSWGTTWYYADANGVGYTGWVKSGSDWYYIQRGVMLTNQYTPDGYYVDANGVYR
ncbi:MAG: hypothetical protein ACI4DO_10705 [Roseburia sp.]